MQQKIKVVLPSQAELQKVLREPEVHEGMTDRAHKGMRHAQATAPVDTGEFRDSFVVTPSSGAGEAEARIGNTDPGAAAIEFGTEDTPAHRTLSQTADYLEREG